MEKITSTISNNSTNTLIAWCCIALGIGLIFVYMFRKTENYIDVVGIIKDHFRIFNKANKHIIVLYIAPVLISIGISLLYKLNEGIIDSIMVIASVIISALLAFQASITNIKVEKDKEARKKKLLEETNSSILFVVLINIILVFLLLLIMAVTNNILYTVLTAVIIYIVIITLLTMFIIMKRVRKLFR